MNLIVYDRNSNAREATQVGSVEVNGVEIAPAGSWMIKLDDGNYEVWGDHEFRHMFTLRKQGTT